MCVRCGTGRIAWCTDPYRHGESDEPVAPGQPPIVTEVSFRTLEVDPTELLPGDIVLYLNEHEESGCHCDVRVTVRRQT